MRKKNNNRWFIFFDVGSSLLHSLVGNRTGSWGGHLKKLQTNKTEFTWELRLYRWDLGPELYTHIETVQEQYSLGTDEVSSCHAACAADISLNNYKLLLDRMLEPFLLHSFNFFCVGPSRRYRSDKCNSATAPFLLAAATAGVWVSV